MKIIKRRERRIVVSYSRFFQRIGDKEGNGFMYPCDEHGKVEAKWLPNVAEAKTDATLRDEGVRLYESAKTDDAVGECDCGKHVVLSGFTNTCQCGSDYNLTGMKLASRSQWGEETGESLDEILSIP